MVSKYHWDEVIVLVVHCFPVYQVWDLCAGNSWHVCEWRSHERRGQILFYKVLSCVSSPSSSSFPSPPHLSVSSHLCPSEYSFHQTGKETLPTCSHQTWPLRQLFTRLQRHMLETQWNPKSYKRAKRKLHHAITAREKRIVVTFLTVLLWVLGTSHVQHCFTFSSASWSRVCIYFHSIGEEAKSECCEMMYLCSHKAALSHCQIPIKKCHLLPSQNMQGVRWSSKVNAQHYKKIYMVKIHLYMP